MLVLCLSVIAGLLALLLVYYRYGHAPYEVFRRMGVPGPPPLPLLGNYLALLRKGELEMYEEWRKEYGPVYGMYAGTRPWLFVSDYDMLHRILISDFTCFSDRPSLYRIANSNLNVRPSTSTIQTCSFYILYLPEESPLLNSEMAGLPLGIFETQTEKWQPLRRLVSPLFTNMKLKQISPLLEESCKTLLKRMRTEHSVDVQTLYEKVVLETALLVVLGQRVSILNGEGGEFVQAVHTASKLSRGNFPFGRMILQVPTQMTLGSTLPWLVSMLRWIGPGRILRHFRVVQDTITSLIHNHKNRTDKIQVYCLLDALLSESENRPDSLSQDEIISHCFNFFVAAYDTTSFTLTCCSYMLATHPHIQDKLCAVLDQYWHNDPNASISTVAQNIPYLDMLIDETLRMFPPTPRTVRTCTQPTNVNGLEIPKEMNIIIPTLLLHTMDEVWEAPHTFRPERFEEEEKSNRPTCSFVPFGHGPRNCIGMKFARLLMKIVLVVLLQDNRFTITPDTRQSLEIDCPTITAHVKHRVFIKLKSRKDH